MYNLLDILIKAKNKYIFRSENDFINCINEIKEFDDNLKLDWDDGAGEEWARLLHENHGVVFMINSKIGIIFARKSYIDNISSKVFSKYEVFITRSYDDDEWYIDLDALSTEVKQISWCASSDAVNPNKFNLNDLYYATI